MPMDQAEFDKRLTVLRECVSFLWGTISTRFPDGFLWDPDPSISGITGSTGEEPLYKISRSIHGVMMAFDHLQEGMGLPKGTEPRFKRACAIVEGKE